MNASRRSYSIRALSHPPDVLGRLSPQVVHLVSQHAWHLRDRDGWIITVTTAPYDGPMAIRVEGESLEAFGVGPGMASRMEDDGLRVGPVWIDLRGARMWGPDHGRAPGPIEWDRLVRDLAAIAAMHGDAYQCGRDSVSCACPPGRHHPEFGVGASCVSPQGFPIPTLWMGESAGLRRRPLPGSVGIGMPRGAQRVPSQALHARTHRLLQAVLDADDEEIAAGAHGLIGLGPGLTPAGDDILCGLVVGLRVLGARLGFCHPRHILAQEALDRAIGDEETRGRTTALSRTLLHCARQGEAPQPLLDVLCSLGCSCSIERGSEPRGVDALLKIGHTSGRDMLTGACLAATAVLGWEDGAAGFIGGKSPLAYPA